MFHFSKLLFPAQLVWTIHYATDWVRLQKIILVLLTAHFFCKASEENDAPILESLPSSCKATGQWKISQARYLNNKTNKEPFVRGDFEKSRKHENTRFRGSQMTGKDVYIILRRTWETHIWELKIQKHELTIHISPRTLDSKNCRYPKCLSQVWFPRRI